MFHFFVGGSSIDSIEKLNVKNLHLVHINDAVAMPPEKLGDRARRDAEQYSWENRVRRIVTWMREMFFEHAAQRQGIPTR